MPAFASAASLDLGTRGTAVGTLQQQLISLGLLSTDNATGYFGALTRAAVQKFQRDRGIVSSGTEATTGYGAVGPKTSAALSEALGAITRAPTNPSIESLLSRLQKLQAELASLQASNLSATSPFTRSASLNTQPTVGAISAPQLTPPPASSTSAPAASPAISISSTSTVPAIVPF